MNHQCSKTKAVLKFFAMFTGKHRLLESLFNKNFKTLSKRDSNTGGGFLRIFKIPVFENLCEQLLLSDVTLTRSI